MPGRLKSITFLPTPKTGQLDLSLRKLATVNILVGANGAGKSRILRAIQMATNISPTVNVSDFLAIDPPSVLLGAETLLQKPDNLMEVSNPDDFQFYFDAAQTLRIQGIGTADYVNPKMPTGEEKTLEVLYRDAFLAGWSMATNSINSKDFFSTGTLRFANFFKEIEELQMFAASHDSNEQAAFVLLVDELETSLHPSAHKIALKKIVELSRTQMFAGQTSGGGSQLSRRQIQLGASLTAALQQPIQVFISTHSPFVVSAAAEYDPAEVKVYLLKNGKTRSIKDESGGEEGYGGMECLFAANWMLGASQQDYIPSKIILAEESIQQFIKTAAKTLGTSVSGYQASTSGDSKSQSAAKNLLEIAQSHLEFGKSQPWKSVLSLQVQVLLDGNPTGDEQKKWDDLEKRFGNAISIVVISDSEFEEIHPSALVIKFLESEGFPQWTSGKFKDYAKSLPYITELKSKSEKAGAIGKLKCELAEFVATRIDLEIMQENYGKLLPFVNGGTMR